MTVACGGPEPTVDATADVWTVNGVCWYAAERSDATVLTTLDRETAVTVTVPRAYEGPLQWLHPDLRRGGRVRAVRRRQPVRLPALRSPPPPGGGVPAAETGGDDDQKPFDGTDNLILRTCG